MLDPEDKPVDQIIADEIIRARAIFPADYEIRVRHLQDNRYIEAVLSSLITLNNRDGVKAALSKLKHMIDNVHASNK